MSEEFGNLDWIRDIKPTLLELHEHGGLSIGDVLILEGYVYDGGGMTPDFMNDFEIEITNVDPNFLMNRFIPINEDLADLLGYDGGNPLFFIDEDEVLVVKEHIKYKVNEQVDTIVFKLLKEQDDFDWIRDIQPDSYESLIGKALEFNPIISYKGDWRVIRDYLAGLGFDINIRLNFLDEDDHVFGLYIHPNGKVVWTGGNFYEDTYREHIENYVGKPVDVLDGRELLRNNIINESEEDDFDWVGEIKPDTDLEIGQLFYKYDVDKDTEPFFIHDLKGKFDDITFKDGRVLMAVESHCQLVDLFIDNDSSRYGYVTKWLAEQVLCEEDYWEPYTDVVYDWEDQVWGAVESDTEIINHIVEHVRDNYLLTEIYYEGKPQVLDEKLLHHLHQENTAQLGYVIDDNDEFNDLKREVTWAYESGYNVAARDGIWKSVNGGIEDYFGEGKWESYTVQKMDGEATRHQLVYDITDVFWDTLRLYFDNCWDDCKRYYEGDHDSEVEEFMDWCDDCWDLPNDNFFEMYEEHLEEHGDKLNPSFNDYPDDDNVLEYFKEDLFNRI